MHTSITIFVFLKDNSKNQSTINKDEREKYKVNYGVSDSSCISSQTDSSKQNKTNISQKKSIIETFQNLFKSHSHTNKKAINANNRTELNKSKNNTVELINFHKTQKDFINYPNNYNNK